MTQEERNLLSKDLCARFPYKVKCEVYDRIGVLDEISSYGAAVNYDNGEETTCKIEYVKPYLFPLSSMSDEQLIIYGDLCYEVIYSLAWDTQASLNELVDWLNSHHFDYRGLIDKGLALDATDKNIY